MGSGRIKGITVEIGGNVTKLDAALKSVDSQLSVTQAKLKDVNYLLKFNPSNVTLLTQKQSALKQAIEQSKQRTKELNTLLNQMKASGAPKEQIEALEREIIQSESKTKALQKELRGLGNPKLTAISTQFKNMGESIRGVSQKIGGVAQKFWPVTKAIAGVSVAAGGLIMKAASTGDRIDKMSQKVGLSRKSFQEMEFVMSQSGTKIESMQTGMKTLTKQMSGAATGSKTSAEAFKKLGVSVTDSDGNLRSQEDVMWDTVKALQGMKNQTEKAKIASQLFGRAGVELMPLLNSEAGSLDKMRKKANDLGLVMSDDAVDASVKFTDTLDQLKRSLMAAGAKIGAALLPHVQKLASYIVQNMPGIQKTIQAVVNKITSVNPAVLKVIAVVTLVAAAIAPVLSTIQLIVGAVGGLVTGIGYLFSPMGLLVAAIAAVVAAGVLLWKNWDKIKKAAATLRKNLKTSFGQIKTAILTAWNAIKSGISKAWTAIRTVVTNGVNAVKSKITAVFNTVKGFVSTVWGSIKSTVSGAIGAIKNLLNFSGAAAKAKNAFEGIRTKIVEKLKAIKDNIKDKLVNGAKALMNFGGWAGKAFTAFEGIRKKVETKLGGIKDTIKNKLVNGAKSLMDFGGWAGKAYTAFESIRTKIETKLGGIKDTIKNKLISGAKSLMDFSGWAGKAKDAFDKIKDGIVDKIQAIKDGIVNKLKSWAWKIPKPKVPKITLNGGKAPWGFGGKGTKPSISVGWQRDAMNMGAIFNKATIFGIDSKGNFIGAGEAGQEVVVGKKSLLTMVRQASASGSAGMERRLANIEKLLGRYLQADTKIVLDTGVVAGAVNRNLGERW